MPVHNIARLPLAAVFLLLFWNAPAFPEPSAVPAGKECPALVREVAGLMVRAYPDAGLSVAVEDGGLYLLAGKNGENGRFLFMPPDGCPEAHPDDPEDAPLCAMFTHLYPAGAGGRHPAPGVDPGRVRNQAFLRFLYGNNAAAVEDHLIEVDFFGESWKFSSRHGAADALRRVAARLDAAVRDNPGLKAYILPGGGTYAWRKIKDSPRLSAHSFGICIDLNVDKGLYWLWHPSEEAVASARRDYPQAIVDAFEAEGFIWGGKWHSFDFMHFEYRPELFVPAGFAGS